MFVDADPAKLEDLCTQALSQMRETLNLRAFWYPPFDEYYVGPGGVWQSVEGDRQTAETFRSAASVASWPIKAAAVDLHMLTKWADGTNYQSSLRAIRLGEARMAVYEANAAAKGCA